MAELSETERPSDAPATEVVTIRDLAHGGEGVGRSDDPRETRVWFVEGALPGERVRAVRDDDHKRWIRGHVVEVLEAAPQRVDRPCSIADRCGGCAWQHVAPEAQAELKRGIVASQLRRVLPRPEGVAPIDSPVLGPVQPSPKTVGYRRRARVHYRRQGRGAEARLELGFFSQGSHDIMDAHRCPVLEPALEWALQQVRAWAAFLPEEGEVLGLTNGREVVLGLPGVRHTPELEQAVREVIESSNEGEDETSPRLSGVQIRGGREHVGIGKTSIELDGPSPAAEGREATRWAPVVQGPFTFSQAQTEQNRALVAHVVAQAKAADKRVLELHAGVGNFTRALAREAKRVWAVDEDREAVSALQRLVERERLPVNAKRGKVERLLEKLAEAGERRYDVVVLDPPRAGIGEQAAKDLAAVAQQRIVYVSCDPATLARDLAVLTEHGFSLVDVRVFDMMPMTAEVETVATLARRPGGQGRGAKR